MREYRNLKLQLSQPDQKLCDIFHCEHGGHYHGQTYNHPEMTPFIGLHISFSLIRPTTVGLLDRSGSAESDADLALLDDNGDIA